MANPVMFLAQSIKAQAAIDKAGFVVSFSPFMDETAAMADLIMPDCYAFELVLGMTPYSPYVRSADLHGGRPIIPSPRDGHQTRRDAVAVATGAGLVWIWALPPSRTWSRLRPRLWVRITKL